MSDKFRVLIRGMFEYEVEVEAEAQEKAKTRVLVDLHHLCVANPKLRVSQSSVDVSKIIPACKYCNAAAASEGSKYCRPCIKTIYADIAAGFVPREGGSSVKG